MLSFCSLVMYYYCSSLSFEEDATVPLKWPSFFWWKVDPILIAGEIIYLIFFFFWKMMCQVITDRTIGALLGMRACSPTDLLEEFWMHHPIIEFGIPCCWAEKCDQAWFNKQLYSKWKFKILFDQVFGGQKASSKFCLIKLLEAKKHFHLWLWWWLVKNVVSYFDLCQKVEVFYLSVEWSFIQEFLSKSTI